MTLAQAAADNRARLIAQLYDEWHGYYMLRRLFMGQWQDVRPLTRDEALKFRCADDEALEIVWRK